MNLKQTGITNINNRLETKNIQNARHYQLIFGISKEHLMNLLIWNRKYYDKLFLI